MKRNLIPFTAVILILMSTAGCSVVRLAEYATGYGVKRTPVGEPEIRRAQLSRQDLQLGISATDNGLSLRLQYLPYYHLEQRQTFTANARLTGLDIVAGLASAGILGWVAYENWTGDGTYIISEDGSFKERRIFDWNGADPWQKAVMIGVPADFVLSAILYKIPHKGTTPWEQKGEESGTRQWLQQHPYRLELRGYDFQKDYRTLSGDETIAIREFLEGMKNPAPFLKADRLEILASTEFEGKPYTETFALTGTRGLQPFRDFARAAGQEKNTEAPTTPSSTSPLKETTGTVVKEVPPDTTPPTIALGTIPTVKAETRRTTIRGSVTSNTGIHANRILINNNGKAEPAATLTANGRFAASIALNEGENRITLTAVDINEQRTEKSVTIHRPPAPPEIQILEPRLDANNFADTRQSTQRVRVRVTDASDITSVTLNGRQMEPTETKNVYALTSTRIVSRRNFIVSAIDIYGSQSSKAFTLHYEKPDKTPPTIVVLEPRLDAKDSATIDTSPFPVTVRITDDSGVAEVKINGQPAPSLEEGKYRRSIRYVVGLEQIEVEATDKAGNAETAQFRIVYQQPQPAPVVSPMPVEENVTADTPLERNDPRILFADSQLEEKRRRTSNKTVFTLEFIVLDESLIKETTVTHSGDGTTYPVSKSGKRDYTVELQLKVGENRFEIRVADEWDNIEIETLIITRAQADTKAPTVTALSVGEGIQIQQIPVRGGYLAYTEPIVVTNALTAMRGRLIDESGIASVKFTRNNNVPEELLLQDGTRFEKKLSLDYGQNEITLTATDTHGNVDETQFTIYQRPDRDGKDFALLFATDVYIGKKDSQGHWRNLTTAIADAKKVAQKLRDNYGFKIKIVENPTRRALLETLFAYQEHFTDEHNRKFTYEPGSQLLIYFAGHGYYNEQAAAGYLITHESEPPKIDPTLSTGIEHEDLRRSIDLITCDRVLVMMDTCFSGTFDPKYKPRISPQLRSLVDDGTLLEQIDMMLKLTARWCVTSASGEYVADSGGKDGHSPFAAAFIAALDTNGGEDKLLKLDEIWQKIQESRQAAIYTEIASQFEKQTGKRFTPPEPRKGQFGAKAELYEESDFLLFPTVTDR